MSPENTQRLIFHFLPQTAILTEHGAEPEVSLLQAATLFVVTVQGVSFDTITRQYPFWRWHTCHYTHLWSIRPRSAGIG